MNKLKLACQILAAALLTTQAFAQARPVLSLATGGDYANLSNNTNIAFIPPFVNNYSGLNSFNSQPLFGGFIGAENDYASNWEWQYGFGYYQNSPFEAKGTVNQFNDTNYGNLNYHYKVFSRRFLLETKIIYVVKEIFHYYLDLGIGDAVNKSYNYHEVPVDSNDYPMAQPFASTTTNSFTYLMGLGVDIDVTKNIRVGGGYRFVGLGKSRLGISSLQEGGNVITNKQIRASELLLQLTFIK